MFYLHVLTKLFCHQCFGRYDIFSLIIFILVVSSVKKKRPTNVKHGVNDSVRKSLAVDVEFQQSKVNALLEKIKSLGKFYQIFYTRN